MGHELVTVYHDDDLPMKTSIRAFLAFAFDLAGPVAAWIGAFLLRFNLEWPDAYRDPMLLGLYVVVPVHALACRWAGLYRGLWIFASLPDLKRVLRAVAISSLALLVLAVLHRTSPAFPRSTLVLYPLLLAAWMAGGRVAYRMLKEHRLYGALSAEGKPVIIVGAGRGGAMLVRELERVPDWRASSAWSTTIRVSGAARYSAARCSARSIRCRRPSPTRRRAT